MEALGNILLYVTIGIVSVVLVGGGMYTLGYCRGSQESARRMRRLQQENQRLEQAQEGWTDKYQSCD